MDCAEEVAVLKRAVGPVVGGEDLLAFDVLNGRMTVAPRERRLPAAAILSAVRATGMRAERWRDGRPSPDDAARWTRHARPVMTVISGLSLVAGLVVAAVAAGGIGNALGSEGMGVTHPVPTSARFLYTIAHRRRWLVCRAESLVRHPEPAS